MILNFQLDHRQTAKIITGTLVLYCSVTGILNFQLSETLNLLKPSSWGDQIVECDYQEDIQLTGLSSHTCHDLYQNLDLYIVTGIPMHNDSVKPA